MPISSEYDEAQLDEVEREQGGKGLRKILEAALDENRQAYQRLATVDAKDVIDQHGLTLVKPEDLAGVTGDLTEAAQKLQAEREAQRQEVLRSVLAERGLEGDALDEALGDLLKPTGDAGGSGWSTVQEVAAIGGQRLNVTPDPENMSGLDLLIQAEAESARKRV